jgi:hypothetical protein
LLTKLVFWGILIFIALKLALALLLMKMEPQHLFPGSTPDAGSLVPHLSEKTLRLLVPPYRANSRDLQNAELRTVTPLLIRSLYGTSERNVNLKNPIPLYITYQTAFVNEAMQLQMRPDIYGLDEAITNLLKGASEVADSPVSRKHTVANKPVMTHVRRPVIAHVLPAARKPKLPSEPCGWEARWDANYFRSRRSAYESFGGFSSW